MVMGRYGHKPKWLWADMVISRNGYGPKWLWTEMVMGRNDPEPLYNMSRDVRKQTVCICENKDAKPISVFVSLNG